MVVAGFPACLPGRSEKQAGKPATTENYRIKSLMFISLPQTLRVADYSPPPPEIPQHRRHVRMSADDAIHSVSTALPIATCARLWARAGKSYWGLVIVIRAMASDGKAVGPRRAPAMP